MKIVNCALLYADGDKYVWSVVTEGAEDLRDFPINRDLVANGSIWENDGTKYAYDLKDEAWKKEESGGGGVSFPTFITNNGDSWTCDMTYAEAKAVYDSEKGDHDSFCPCRISANGASEWDVMLYLTREQIASASTINPPLPEDLIGGLKFNRDKVYGSDGNFYEEVHTIGDIGGK